MGKQPRLILAKDFFAALVRAGIFHEDQGNTTYRVVIDAKAGHAVKIYVERAADERLLSVVMGLDGVEVKTGMPAGGPPSCGRDTRAHG